MISKFVRMEYIHNENIWVGKYRNLHNLPHWHVEYEIIYVKSGTAEIMIEENRYHAKEGDAFLCGSGDTHRITGSQDSIIITMLLNTTLVKEVIAQYALCTPKLEHAYPLEEFYRKIFEELTNLQPFFKIKVDAYISDLVVEIFRKENIELYKKKGTHYEKYKDLQRILNDNLESITFEEAAKKMGFSEPYFSKYFKKMFGMTYSRYMQILKVERAIQLLSDKKMNFTEIAEKCGFDSIRTFNRVFKTVTGVTPRNMSKEIVPDTFGHKDFTGIFNPTMPVSEYIDYSS